MHRLTPKLLFDVWFTIRQQVFLRLDLCVVFEDHTSQVKISSYMVSSVYFIARYSFSVVFAVSLHAIVLCADIFENEDSK